MKYVASVERVAIFAGYEDRFTVVPAYVCDDDDVCELIQMAYDKCADWRDKYNNIVMRYALGDLAFSIDGNPADVESIDEFHCGVYAVTSYRDKSNSDRITYQVVISNVEK